MSTVQPSLMDASLITWNQEEGADGHGKDREAIEDRRDAMSGLLFSSEAVGRALVFLLSQPLLFTIPQQPVQTLGVILINAAAFVGLIHLNDLLAVRCFQCLIEKKWANQARF